MRSVHARHAACPLRNRFVFLALSQLIQNRNGFLRPKVLQLHLLASRPRPLFLVDRLPLLSPLHHLWHPLRLLLGAQRDHGHAPNRSQVPTDRSEEHGQHEQIRLHLIIISVSINLNHDLFQALFNIRTALLNVFAWCMNDRLLRGWVSGPIRDTSYHPPPPLMGFYLGSGNDPWHSGGHAECVV